MNKYLFLVGDLPPSPSANGVCAEKIMNCLYDKKNSNVFCVLWENNKIAYNYPYEMFFIKGRQKNTNQDSKIIKLFFRIKAILTKLFLLPFFPMSSRRIAKDFYKTSKSIIIENNITHVIAISFPGESLYALKRIKKKFKNKIKAIAYPLDVSLEGDRTRFKFWNVLSKHFGIKMINSVAKQTDVVLALENARELYLKSLCKKNHRKLKFVGIPMVENITVGKKKKENNKISILYAGYLTSDMYNPIPFLDELEKKIVNSHFTIIFELFGICDSKLKSILSTKYEKIIFVDHGWVTESELNNAMADADAFLSISKTITNTIPSKIFKYMCLKKPIIHYYYEDNDSCLPYLSIYKKSFLVKHDSASFDVKRLSINDLLNEQIDIDVEKTFPSCTPKYTANIIKNS